MTATHWRVLGLLVLVALIVAALLWQRDLDTQAMIEWFRSLGPLAPLLFVLVYAAATVLFLPGSALTLAAGALFGPWLGGLYALTGATLGATLAFLIARYVLADWVRARSAGWLERVFAGVEAEGWRFVAFTRLVPLFPFNALNYALGLTRIPLLQYVLTSAICMAPGAVAYAYIGFAGREALSGGEDLIQKLLLAVALIAAIWFLPRVVKRVRGGGQEHG